MPVLDYVNSNWNEGPEMVQHLMHKNGETWFELEYLFAALAHIRDCGGTNTAKLVRVLNSMKLQHLSHGRRPRLIWNRQSGAMDGDHTT